MIKTELWNAKRDDADRDGVTKVDHNVHHVLHNRPDGPMDDSPDSHFDVRDFDVLGLIYGNSPGEAAMKWIDPEEWWHERSMPIHTNDGWCILFLNGRDRFSKIAGHERIRIHRLYGYKFVADSHSHQEEAA